MRTILQLLVPILLPILLVATTRAQESDAVFDAPLVLFPSTSSIDSVADLDGDGDLDGIGWYFRYTSGTNARVRAFLNDGHGAFTPDWSLDLPIFGGLRTTWALATGSLDRDANADRSDLRWQAQLESPVLARVFVAEPRRIGGERVDPRVRGRRAVGATHDAP